MFDFKMNYSVSLNIKSINSKSIALFCTALQNVLPFSEEFIQRNEEALYIRFPISMAISHARNNLQNLQIFLFLINNKLRESNMPECRVNGNLIATPVFDFNHESIALSGMMDKNTQDDFNIVIRDNVFYKPYGLDPMFSEAVGLLREKYAA